MYGQVSFDASIVNSDAKVLYIQIVGYIFIFTNLRTYNDWCMQRTMRVENHQTLCIRTVFKFICVTNTLDIAN